MKHRQCIGIAAFVLTMAATIPVEGRLAQQRGAAPQTPPPAAEPAAAQGGRGAGGRGQAPQTARAAAPIDLTGQWVSVVTEDWRFRMVTPPKGDFAAIPTNPAGVQVGQQGDPATDEAAGEQCKSYGAAAIMRVPGRIRISWDNDTTLKVETDAGQQTRMFRFGEPQP